MRTHDVQDIDCQVMEMIRSKLDYILKKFLWNSQFFIFFYFVEEAVENYLPENIRPRRAWHLAKASLRTLKRTLNNRK